MPTPAERKALLYLGGLLCLGAVVRAAGSVRAEPPPAEVRAALARQIEAVDSARRAGKRGRGKQPAAAARPPRAAPARAATRLARPDSTVPIDLDTASAALLEALPGIGPALARRVVEDRERGGPFGSLEGFQRVRGVGPALARAVAARVTFSGTRRLTRAAFPPLGGPRAAVAP